MEFHHIIVFSTVLATNWLPITIEKPTGAGGVAREQKEIGIIVSNRYATFEAEGPAGITNRVLTSSTVHMPPQMLLREPVQFMVPTNVWNFRPHPGGSIIFTNLGPTITIEQ